jgi:transposase
MGQTSQNSSRPPSSDPPDAPARRQRPASGRKRGAQPGHARHERKLLPANEVDAVIEHHALVCPDCQATLEVDLPDVGEAERQQVWDIPEVKPMSRDTATSGWLVRTAVRRSRPNDRQV